MPTTVTRTIGTGGDYSTPQAWEDACPANLVAVDQIWRGELKNQEFGNGSSNVLTVGGITTDATRYVELTTEAGASFADNANVNTNALRYNAANGAAINGGGGYSNAIEVATDTHLLLSKFMVRHSSTGVAINQAGDGGFTRIRQVIAESAGTLNHVVVIRNSSSFIANSLVVSRGTGPIIRPRSDAGIYNCTLARTGASSNEGISAGYSNPVVRNTAIFGVNVVAGGGTPSYTNCFTNVASPPAGCTTTAYSTTTGAQFENITDGTHDFRIKSGSTLANAGATDATFGTPSINGRTRPEGAAYDVGAWELVGASAATAITLTGPSSGTVGNPSTNFTVGANGTITGTITVTPNDGGDGGTFSPTSVAISAASPNATFTYTAANAGSPTATISVTNNGGLTNPAGIAYSATVPSATQLVVSVPDAAGLTGFSGFVLSASAPGAGVTILRNFTGVNFNGSGQATLDATGLSIPVGARRWVSLTNSTGDPAQSPAPVQAQGPVQAS